MVNAININHNTKEIMPTYDGILYEKMDNGWEESQNVLYKSLYTPDNSIGKNGDYYCEYIEKYNLLRYSNDFDNTLVWDNNNIILSKDNFVTFPLNYPSTKLIPNTILSEHSLEYNFDNDMENEPYSFSIYAIPNELTTLGIRFSDNDERFGVDVKYNLNTLKSSFNIFGDENEFELNDYGIIEYESEDYLRLYINVNFKFARYLKIKIYLFNENGKTEFINTTPTDGLFINCAQLTKNTIESFNYSASSATSYFVLDKFYKKENDVWVIKDNVVHYFDENTDDKIGNTGDIAIIESIINLEPIVKFGDATNINGNSDGLIYWSEKHNTYYVNGKKGQYKIMFTTRKPHRSGFLKATSLSNKTYQGYTGKSLSKTDYRIGYNTGSHYNFWAENRLLPRRF